VLQITTGGGEFDVQCTLPKQLRWADSTYISVGFIGEDSQSHISGKVIRDDLIYSNPEREIFGGKGDGNAGLSEAIQVKKLFYIRSR
jgi:hypothetical protein